MYVSSPLLGDPIRDQVPDLPTVVRGTAPQVVSCNSAERDQIAAAVGRPLSIDEIKEAIRIAADGAAIWADTSAEALKPAFRAKPAIQEHFLATFGIPTTRALSGAGGQMVNAASLVQIRFLSTSRYLREAHLRIRCLAACPDRPTTDNVLCMTMNGNRMFIGTRFWLAFGEDDQTALKFGMLVAAFAAWFGMELDHPKNPFRASRRYATFAMQLFGESSAKVTTSPPIPVPATP